ncbi:MAG: helix-turn-helix transcriptional regulator [Bacilli bacterium]|nr:helix-turn-helix transcriptional regulator [Bacilli bacterium]
MEFAEKLKTLRKDSDLTQQEVADKLYISRSLYAKYESGIAVPNKDILEKISLLFNVSVNELVSYEETTLMVVEEHNTREKLKNITLITSLVICAIFIIFYFIPVFQVYSYKYPAPAGQQPERIMTLMSSFSLLNSKGVPLGNITLGFCVIEIVLSILCLTIFNKRKIVVRYIAYINFALVVFLIFMTVAFSCGYSF